MNVLEKFSLAGQVGIVTGGGQGLGRAFCQAFAEAGADLVVAEVNPETGADAAAMVRGLGNRALYLHTDVRLPESVRAMVDRAQTEFGQIDFLVNNAGVNQWCDAIDWAPGDWNRIFDVNLNGLFLCCQTVARHMIDQGKGSIINIASMSGLTVNRPQPQAAYNASKAAVVHLTRSLAVEWAPHGIRVNAIAPGYMSNVKSKPFFSNPEYGELWLESVPMKRLGEPEELGPAAVFLASDASSFVTGHTLVIDGGYTVC